MSCDSSTWAAVWTTLDLSTCSMLFQQFSMGEYEHSRKDMLEKYLTESLPSW